MLKYILLVAIVAAVGFGVIAYEDDKVTLHTEKGKELLDKTKEFVKENVEVK